MTEYLLHDSSPSVVGKLEFVKVISVVCCVHIMTMMQMCVIDYFEPNFRLKLSTQIIFI